MSTDIEKKRCIWITCGSEKYESQRAIKGYTLVIFSLGQVSLLLSRWNNHFFIVKNSLDVRAEISLLGVSASSYLLEIM